jgi:hypothetical protein
MTTIQKAVELKRLIDSAPTYLSPIGTCFNLEYEWKQERRYESDDDESESSDLPEKEEESDDFLSLQNSLEFFYSLEEFEVFNKLELEDLGLRINGVEFNPEKLTQEQVEEWYKAATPSNFGNVKDQETQNNPTIRASREFDFESGKVQIGDKFIEDLRVGWGMKPEKVDVKPYKLVIYGPGDHFTWHKDTPEQRLCGTTLICLFDNCDGKFEITPNLTGVTKT